MTDVVRIASTSRDCCRISRDTLSGRSFESIDPAHEAQVRRHQLLGIVHDEHAADVELDAAPVLAIPEIERRALRHEEQLREFLTAFDSGVHVRERRLEVVADVLVELVVLLVGDLRLGPRPQRRGLVDLLVLVGHGPAPSPWRPTAPSS